MTSRGAERGVTASLAFEGLHRMELSPRVTFPKMCLECTPMLRQDQKSAGHIPESTHGQAVPVWKGESLFLLKGWCNSLRGTVGFTSWAGSF